MACRRTALVLCFAVLAAQLAACGNQSRAPVEDRSGKTSSPSTAGSYTVQRGDTLYSIAFRYGLDYRRLAAANGIAAPYTIYAGQRLQLRESDPPRVASSQSSARSAAAAPPPAPAAKPSPTAPPVAAVTKPSPQLLQHPPRPTRW